MAQHTITFDTFQYAKDLKKAGFTEIQVETQVKYAKEQANNVNEVINDDLATKQDMKALKQELKQDIKELKTELELKIEQMGCKTIVGLGSMIAISVTVLGFLINH